jgi:hypothetical protein
MEECVRFYTQATPYQGFHPYRGDRLTTPPVLSRRSLRHVLPAGLHDKG